MMFVFVYVVLAGAAAVGLAQTREGVDKEQLRTQLLEKFKRELSLREATLVPDGERALEEAIRKGVDRLFEDGVTKARLQKTNANVDEVVKDLTKGIDRRIDEQKVKASFRSLCPLYPFC
jgi:hypothetical protein